MGALAWRVTNYFQAKTHLKEGIELCKKQQDFIRAADFLNQMGWIETLQGNSQQAKQYLVEAFNVYQKAGRLEAVVENLHTQGFALLEAGDLQEAEGILRQALDLAREITDQIMMPHLLNQLGFVAYELGDYPRAEVLCQEALRIAKEDVNIHARGWGLVVSGKVAMALSDYVSAQVRLTQALEMEWSLQYTAPAIGALVAIAELWLKQGRAEEAVCLFNMSLHHPATGKYSKTLAQRVLNELHDQLPAEVMTRAVECGKAASLQEVVEKILRQSPPHP